MSISLEIKGVIHAIGKEVSVTEKFKKRDFVLFVENEANPTYSDHIQMQMTQDKCSKLDEVEIGYEVNCFVNVRGKEYAKKDGTGMGYFTTLEAWKLDVLKNVSVSSGSTGLIQREEPLAGVVNESDDSGNDLPF